MVPKNSSILDIFSANISFLYQGWVQSGGSFICSVGERQHKYPKLIFAIMVFFSDI